MTFNISLIPSPREIALKNFPLPGRGGGNIQEYTPLQFSQFFRPISYIVWLNIEGLNVTIPKIWLNIDGLDLTMWKIYICLGQIQISVWSFERAKLGRGGEVARFPLRR